MVRNVQMYLIEKAEVKKRKSYYDRRSIIVGLNGGSN